MIPKRIHLCWLSGDPYPQKIQKCIDSWKVHLPDYEIMLWDLKRFDIAQVPWVEQAFRVKKYAFAAEAAIIGAEKGCDWIKACLDYYKGRNFIQENGQMDIRMLPEIMNETIQRFKPVVNLTDSNIDALKGLDMEKAVYVLPNDFFSPKIFDSREVIVTGNTYAIHHYQNSWFSHQAFIYYRTRTFFIKLFGYNCIRRIEKLILKR